MIIPPDKLAPETLRAILESYVHREGTDYGEREISVETRISQLREQLRREEVFLVFDQVTESCNLLTQRQLNELSKQVAAQDSSWVDVDQSSPYSE